MKKEDQTRSLEGVKWVCTIWRAWTDDLACLETIYNVFFTIESIEEMCDPGLDGNVAALSALCVNLTKAVKKLDAG